MKGFLSCVHSVPSPLDLSTTDAQQRRLPQLLRTTQFGPLLYRSFSDEQRKTRSSRLLVDWLCFSITHIVVFRIRTNPMPPKKTQSPKSDKMTTAQLRQRRVRIARDMADEEYHQSIIEDQIRAADNQHSTYMLKLYLVIATAIIVTIAAGIHSLSPRLLRTRKKIRTTSSISDISKAHSVPLACTPSIPKRYIEQLPHSEIDENAKIVFTFGCPVTESDDETEQDFEQSRNSGFDARDTFSKEPSSTRDRIQKELIHIITPRNSTLSLEPSSSSSISSNEESEDSTSRGEDIIMDDCSVTTKWTCVVPLNSSAPIKSRTMKRILGFVALILCLCAGGFRTGRSPSMSTSNPTDSDCIYVPGAGFSGFWFTLGRLQSVTDPTTQRYYCFSAGCLGAVTALSNITLEMVLDVALNIQRQWKEGTLSRFQVVEQFVDRLLSKPTLPWLDGDELSGTNHTGTSIHHDRPVERHEWVGMRDPYLLSRLNIITTTFPERQGGWLGGVDVSIRTPSSIEELKEMLLQTTWM